MNLRDASDDAVSEWRPQSPSVGAGSRSPVGGGLPCRRLPAIGLEEALDVFPGVTVDGRLLERFGRRKTSKVPSQRFDGFTGLLVSQAKGRRARFAVHAHGGVSVEAAPGGTAGGLPAQTVEPDGQRAAHPSHFADDSADRVFPCPLKLVMPYWPTELRSGDSPLDIRCNTTRATTPIERPEAMRAWLASLVPVSGPAQRWLA